MAPQPITAMWLSRGASVAKAICTAKCAEPQDSDQPLPPCP